MGDNAILFSFGLYVLYVLLPIVPAIILFRMFPDTKVAVSGPLQNLTVNTTGAFAAYVVTVGLGYFVVQNVKDQINDLNAEVWTVSIPIHWQDSKRNPLSGDSGITDGILLDFDAHLYTPGDDFIYVTVPFDGKSWRTIKIGKAGFETATVALQELIDSHDRSKVEIKPTGRVINVLKPIILKQVSAEPYAETQAVPSKSLAELRAGPPGP